MLTRVSQMVGRWVNFQSVATTDGLSVCTDSVLLKSVTSTSRVKKGKRCHSTLGYVSPKQFDQQMQSA